MQPYSDTFAQQIDMDNKNTASLQEYANAYSKCWQGICKTMSMLKSLKKSNSGIWTDFCRNALFGLQETMSTLFSVVIVCNSG